MKIIKTLYRSLKARLLSSLYTDLTSILSGFDKLQVKLDRYIAKEQNDLTAIHQNLVALSAARDAKNASIDRAYRVSHKLDQLVA